MTKLQNQEVGESLTEFEAIWRGYVRYLQLMRDRSAIHFPDEELVNALNLRIPSSLEKITRNNSLLHDSMDTR